LDGEIRLEGEVALNAVAMISACHGRLSWMPDRRRLQWHPAEDGHVDGAVGQTADAGLGDLPAFRIEAAALRLDDPGSVPQAREGLGCRSMLTTRLRAAGPDKGRR
jgi:hypothetical protein